MTEREWDIEVMRLEDFFDTVTLPAGPINVGGFMTIHDPRMFVDACLRNAKNAEHNHWHSGNIARLQLLEKHLRS